MCNKLCVILIPWFVSFNLKFLMKCFSCALALELFLFLYNCLTKNAEKEQFLNTMNDQTVNCELCLNSALLCGSQYHFNLR